ncbi:MAG: hypothetical protein AB1457_18265, partial [Chloroflexota bacterium]
QLITVSSVHRESGASRTTVRKHRDLLASWIGDYIRGGTRGLAVVCSSEAEVEQEQLSEIEISSGAGCVLDSLRSDRTGQTARNSRQVTTEVLAAVHPIQSNYGVKHELTRSAPYVASGGIACGINGTPPKGDPSIYSSAFFSIGAPAPNLRQVGNRPDGLAYKRARLNYSTSWLNEIAHAQQLDKAKSQVMPIERAFGYVPLSCYDKRRQRAGGWLLSSNGYIACKSGGKAMGNEANEKHEQPNRPTERQTDYEKRAQGEVNANVSDYTEKVMATRLEKKLSGNSGVTGQLPDKNGKGLASAKDLLGDDAHGLSKKEKNAALMAQIEKDGYIVGKPQDKPVLIADNPVKDAYKYGWEHPGRKNPDAQVDYASASKAYEVFDLAKHGVPKSLIGGMLRNEQYWMQGQDKYLQDPGIQMLKEIPITEHSDFSIGPAQMRMSNIKHLVEKYPKQLANLQDDPAEVVSVGGMAVGTQQGRTMFEKALEPKNAALLVGAYFADKIERLESGQPCNPDCSHATNEKLAKLWKSGNPEKQLEALIKSYNPRDAKHFEHVKEQMKLVNEKHLSD